MRTFLAVVFALAISLPAWAGGYAGYHFPTSETSDCTPVCDGVRVTYVEPTPIYVGTNGESANIASVWVGIHGGTSHGTCAGGNKLNPLIQFGTEPQISNLGVVTHRLWYEEYPCNNITYFGSLVINSGDVVTLTLLCTANCIDGDATQVWTMLWENKTTGLSQSRTEVAGYKVYMEQVDAVIEPQSPSIGSTSYQPLHFLPMKFSQAQLHQGGAWIDIPIGSSRSTVAGWKQIKSGPTTMSLYSASPPVGTNGVNYYVCSTVAVQTSTAPPACPASSYQSSAGFGP